ncbi:MAG: hypothetical protein DRI77_05325, partial [Chloroflexi bacterium]
DTATLTVNHADAASVALDPATETIEAGEAVTYTAVATDSYGNSWGATAAYTITPGAGGGWTDNIYTSAISGTWTVTGTVDGVDGVATLTVNPGGLDYVIIRTASDGGGEVAGNHVMATDETWTLWAAGYDAGDNYIGDVSVDWSVTGDSIGTVVPSTDSISTTLYATAEGTGRVSAEHATAMDDETGDIAVSAGAPSDTYIYLPLVVRGN